MRQSERFGGGLACACILAACSGFDPASLVPPQKEPDDGGAAGYSYEPGPSGGRTGTRSQSSGTDGSGALSSLGTGGTATGSSSDGGTDGAAGPVSNAGAGRGGANGGAKSKGGAGGGTASAGAGRGGASSELGGAGESGGVGGGPAALPRELLFSEYVEAGADKALEILALATTNLEGCTVETYSNGSSTPRQTLKLAAPLDAGAVYTLCSSKLASKVVCDRPTNLSFNGNDAIALVCDGATLDVIGQIGVDPGDAWSSTDDDNAGASGAGASGASGAGGHGAEPSGAQSSTADQTLRRRCGVTRGDADGSDRFDPSVEWVALPADTLDGLGDPACG